MASSSTPFLRRVATPCWLACAVILVAAKIGLGPGLNTLEQRFRKHPISVRRPLDEFRVDHLPTFRLADKTTLPPLLTSETVGTDSYVYLGLEDITAGSTDATASLFVTYYNEEDDPIPHTPEVCYRQTRAIVRDMTSITLQTPELGPEHATIDARLLRIERPGGQVIIAYLFCANGNFAHDREVVRLINARPGDRYVYFSKIEAITFALGGADPQAAIERSRRLLQEAIVVLIKDHFPRNEDLREH